MTIFPHKGFSYYETWLAKNYLFNDNPDIAERATIVCNNRINENECVAWIAQDLKLFAFDVFGKEFPDGTDIYNNRINWEELVEYILNIKGN